MKVKPYKIVHQSGKKTTLIVSKGESEQEVIKIVSDMNFRDKAVKIYFE